MKLLARLLVSSLALLATAYVVPGFHVDGITAALIAAVVLGLVNMFIKPIMLLVTLPITLLTLGLFTFVINALMLALTSYLVPGFDIDGLVATLIGTLVLSIASTLISWLVPGD